MGPSLLSTGPVLPFSGVTAAGLASSFAGLSASASSAAQPSWSSFGLQSAVQQSPVASPSQSAAQPTQIRLTSSAEDPNFVAAKAPVHSRLGPNPAAVKGKGATSEQFALFKAETVIIGDQHCRSLPKQLYQTFVFPQFDFNSYSAGSLIGKGTFTAKVKNLVLFLGTMDVLNAKSHNFVRNINHLLELIH